MGARPRPKGIHGQGQVRGCIAEKGSSSVGRRWANETASWAAPETHLWHFSGSPFSTWARAVSANRLPLGLPETQVLALSSVTEGRARREGKALSPHSRGLFSKASPPSPPVGFGDPRRVLSSYKDVPFGSLVSTWRAKDSAVSLRLFPFGQAPGRVWDRRLGPG